jgi:hypothetical protein
MSILGKGSTLKQGTTKITKCKVLGVPKVSYPEVPSTNLDSTAEEKISGLKSVSGNLTVQADYDKTIYATVVALADGVSKPWTVTYPDGATLALTGWVTDIGPEPVENTNKTMEYSFSVVPDNASSVVFTPGT